MSSTMSIRLETDLKSRLEELSESMKRSKSWLAKEAIRNYVEVNEWQIEEVEKSLVEANQKDFAPEEEVEEFFKQWLSNEN